MLLHETKDTYCDASIYKLRPDVQKLHAFLLQCYNFSKLVLRVLSGPNICQAQSTSLGNASTQQKNHMCHGHHYQATNYHTTNFHCILLQPTRRVSSHTLTIVVLTNMLIFLRIRNKIYQYVLQGSDLPVCETKSKEELVTPTLYAIRESRQSPPNALLPSRNALVHTCRQAYQEAAKIYYQRNVISVFSDPVCSAFAHSLSPSHIASIVTLHIHALAVQRPLTFDFHSRRNDPLELPCGGVIPMRTVDDYNFMSAKQIQRLHIFSNLRRLRFFGRWRDSAWRPGPSVTLL